jgi:hypothetical protein
MKTKYRVLRTAASLSVGGCLLQLGGCFGLGAVTNVLSDINPCGTILNCDPDTFDFVTSGYEGPGADPEVDFNCTFPPFCDGPIVAPDPNIDVFGGEVIGGDG